MALTLAGSNRGVSFAHVISCGNQLDVTVAELFEACLRDPAVRVLAAIIEGVPDIAHFRKALDSAAKRDIPVVVLKVGESERGQAATVAHTGSLSGSAALFRALFRQHGVIQVNDLDELIAVSALLNAPHRPRATGVAVFASSGGEVGLISDLGESLGVLPGRPTKVRHRSPPCSRLRSGPNPLDITAGGWGDAELYPKVIAGSPGSPASTRSSVSPTHRPWRATTSSKAGSGSSTGCSRAPRSSRAGRAGRRPEYHQRRQQRCATRLRRRWRRTAGRPPAVAVGTGQAASYRMAGRARRSTTDPAARPRPRGGGPRQPAELLAGTRPARSRSTSPSRSWPLRHRSPPPRLAATAEEAVEPRADRISRRLKWPSPGSQHKTEVGGVRLI